MRPRINGGLEFAAKGEDQRFTFDREARVQFHGDLRGWNGQVATGGEILPGAAVRVQGQDPDAFVGGALFTVFDDDAPGHEDAARRNGLHRVERSIGAEPDPASDSEARVRAAVGEQSPEDMRVRAGPGEQVDPAVGGGGHRLGSETQQVAVLAEGGVERTVGEIAPDQAPFGSDQEATVWHRG